MSHVLVVYEIRDNQIKKVSFEATSAACKLAADSGGDVSALLIGNNLDDLAQRAGDYGATKVFLADSPQLTQYSPDVYAQVIARAAKESGATHILMGASSMGKDLMPRVGYLLGAAVAQDIIGFEQKDGKQLYLRPIIAGKLQAHVSLTSDIHLATLRPNIFPASEKKETPQIVKLSLDLPAPRLVVSEIVSSGGGKIDVTEAEIIVSGGRGMQGPDNWNLIEDLAKALGAAMGASRAVVDAGWRDHGEQVGQTGKTVSPNLYVACGISGAIQHQAGMASSKYIVAINKDPEAPIFKIADYGIVGDVFQVLPKLTEEIKKVKSE